jgi:hypothetical protein
VFYGYSSHILHIQPRQDWLPDADYTVEIAAGMPYIDGTASPALSWGFTTREPEPQTATLQPTEEKGCSTSGVHPINIGLLLFLAAITSKRRATV